MTAGKLCSKCHKNPKRRHQRYCVKCHNIYQRNYRKKIKAQAKLYRLLRDDFLKVAMPKVMREAA